MIVYTLLLFLNGQFLVGPVVFHSETKCAETGAQLIAAAEDTGARGKGDLTFRCLAALESDK